MSAKLKHGLYAKPSETALSRRAELTEQYSDREGIKAALTEQAAMLTQLREVTMDFVLTEIRAGTPLDEIGSFDRILAFFNSERLSLVALEKLLAPDQRGKHNAKKVLDLYE